MSIPSSDTVAKVGRALAASFMMSLCIPAQAATGQARPYPVQPGVIAYSMSAAGQRFFFWGSRDGQSTGAWTSDGTDAGTIPLSDVDYGGRPAYPGWFVDPTFAVVNRESDQEPLTFFIGYDAVEGIQLWASDGTVAGTLQLSTRSSGFTFPTTTYIFDDKPVESQLFVRTALHGRLWIAAADGHAWASDGTLSGTVPAVSIDAGEGTEIVAMHAVDDGLFLVTEAGQRYALWRTDGFGPDAEHIADLEALPSDMAHIGQELFFVMQGAIEPGLWRSNGTLAGTERILDVPAAQLLAARGQLYFVAGDRLWVGDGTAAGTHASDTFPPDGECARSEYFLQGRELDGEVFFRVNCYNAVRQRSWQEIWRTDGTESRVVLSDLADNLSLSGEFARIDDTLYFYAYGDEGKESGLWAIGLENLAPTPVCAGDCDADGRVSVAELMQGVNLALAHPAETVCASLDTNTSGTITIDELVAAVNHTLRGCPSV